MAKKEETLNGKTPKWFEEWHYKYFIPVKDTAGGNRKWIYIIVAAIVAAAVTGNFDFNTIAKTMASIIGG